MHRSARMRANPSAPISPLLVEEAGFVYSLKRLMSYGAITSEKDAAQAGFR